LHSIIL